MSINAIQKNLTSDVARVAKHLDTNMQNPWGLVKHHKHFWVANNGTGLLSQYKKDGCYTGKYITVSTSAPTGLVKNNDKTRFTMDGHHSIFITCTESGTIEGWNPVVTGDLTRAVYLNEGSYTGLVLFKHKLFAANFGTGMVDILDSNFNLVDSFTDAELSATGYAPFNVYAYNNKLYVTFVKRGSTGDDESGIGNGYIDVFDCEGCLIKRLVNRGHLNSPWGMAASSIKIPAPTTSNPNAFKIIKVLLVGNFGDGRINVYNRKCGTLITVVQDKFCNEIIIDGLWGLLREKKCRKIYFAAGINDEENGLFGRLKRVNKCCCSCISGTGCAAPVYLEQGQSS